MSYHVGEFHVRELSCGGVHVRELPCGGVSCA